METLEDLHGRFVDGDSRAASKIVEIALPQMVRIVTRLVPKLHDGHEDACHEALLDYLVAPKRYDPTRAGLTARPLAGHIRRALQYGSSRGSRI
jgi:DNA-directed RNA polymerase specialized sigma24 family protein